jgi:hypothetical protein
MRHAHRPHQPGAAATATDVNDSETQQLLLLSAGGAELLPQQQQPATGHVSLELASSREAGRHSDSQGAAACLWCVCRRRWLPAAAGDRMLIDALLKRCCCCCHAVLLQSAVRTRWPAGAGAPGSLLWCVLVFERYTGEAVGSACSGHLTGTGSEY